MPRQRNRHPKLRPSPKPQPVRAPQPPAPRRAASAADWLDERDVRRLLEMGGQRRA